MFLCLGQKNRTVLWTPFGDSGACEIINIARLFAHNMKAKYPERNVTILVMECMPGGELVDISTNIFSSIMRGVEALHNRHIDHRD